MQAYPVLPPAFLNSLHWQLGQKRKLFSSISKYLDFFQLSSREQVFENIFQTKQKQTNKKPYQMKRVSIPTDSRVSGSIPLTFAQCLFNVYSMPEARNHFIYCS